MIIEIETHPLQTVFALEMPCLLMLKVFHRHENKWKMDFTIRTFKTICGEIFGLIFFKIKLIF